MVCRLCQIWPKYQYDTLMGILKASVEFSAPGGQLGICWVSLISPTLQMYNWVSPSPLVYISNNSTNVQLGISSSTGRCPSNSTCVITTISAVCTNKQTVWVRFCHHSANPVLESYGEGLEVESTLSESTYSHTKYISLF